MPCDRSLKAGQTLTERVAEVKTIVQKINDLMTKGAVKLKIGPTGAPVLIGLPNEVRDGVSDVCAVRRLMTTGSMKVKAMLSTAPLNKQAMAHGHHSHDGGQTWHNHK